MAPQVHHMQTESQERDGIMFDPVGFVLQLQNADEDNTKDKKKEN